MTGRLWRRVAALAAAAAAGWMLSPDLLAQGCSMCRTALEGQEDKLSDALSVSTLVLASMPFAVVASVGGWILLALRRAGREEGATWDTHAPRSPDTTAGSGRQGTASRPPLGDRGPTGPRGAGM